MTKIPELQSQNNPIAPTADIDGGALLDCKPNSKEALNHLNAQMDTLLAPMGYEVVAAELITAGGRALRVSIDFIGNSIDPLTMRRISIDDCVAVNTALDPMLENTPYITGAYNLEVSSPGVERPLRKPSDYTRFAGNKVRVGTFRPLTGEELSNEPYWEKNKKQKNFIGQLKGLSNTKQGIVIEPEGYKPAPNTTAEVTIPLELVTKAHLEYVEPREK